MRNIESNVKKTIHWDSIQDLFSCLKSQNYLILRGDDKLPNAWVLEQDFDLDILCEDKLSFINKAKLVSINGSEYNFVTFIAKKPLYIDLRCICDGYYDQEWCAHMLNTKVVRNEYFVLNKETELFSILYHVLIHKADISSKYRNSILALLIDLGHPILSNLRFCQTWLLSFILARYMGKQGYSLSTPADPSVFINKKNLKVLRILIKLFAFFYMHQHKN